MNSRINRITAAVILAGQAGATVSTGSALAGVAVALVTLALIGPSHWSRRNA